MYIQGTYVVCTCNNCVNKMHGNLTGTSMVMICVLHILSHMQLMKSIAGIFVTLSVI